MPALLPRARFEKRLVGLADDPPVSYALIDLDGFKELNDSEGREKGDALLSTVSRMLADALPDGVLAAHIGGDAWACILPGASPEEALLTLEPIRRSLAPLRLSVGIAGFPDHAEEVSALHRLADEALARAKRDRGNKTAIYVEEKMILKSNYYPRGQLERLAALAERLGRTEASLLRDALADLLDRNREAI